MATIEQQQARLDEAFNRIEETILPCIAMMLDTLLDASANMAELDPKALAAELQTLAAELEELTRAVEPEQPRAGHLSSRLSDNPGMKRGIDVSARHDHHHIVDHVDLAR